MEGNKKRRAQGVKPLIIIQARLKSARLPGKVFKKAGGLTLIEHLLTRLESTRLPMVLAVPRGDLAHFHIFKKKFPVTVLGGNEKNVLSRYMKAARLHNGNPIIRVTADNPLTSGDCLLYALKKYQALAPDLFYLTGLPYGSGVEIISRSCLENLQEKTLSSLDKEHVTRFIYLHPMKFIIKNLPCPRDYRFPDLRTTIDTPKDLKWFRKVLREVKGENHLLRLKEVINWSRKNQRK